MQAKGLIKFFVILLTIVCLYQLSFTYFASSIESTATEVADKRLAQDDTTGMTPPEVSQLHKTYYVAYLDSVYNKTVLDFGITEYTYKDVKSRSLSLGLDLQGGMNVVLQVSLKEMLIAMANNSQNEAFRQALEDADKAQFESDEDYVSLFFQAYTAQPDKEPLYKIFATQENAGRIDYGDTDEQIIAEIQREAEGAVQRTYEVIQSRIDEFGVASPSVTLQEGSNRIIIELPGIDNPKRARSLLQSTAKLEFWEVWFNTEVFNGMLQANQTVREKMGLIEDTVSTDTDTTSLLEVVGDAPTDDDTTVATDGEESSLLGEGEVADSNGEGDFSEFDLGEDGDSTALTSNDEEEARKQYPLFGTGYSLIKPVADENGQAYQSPVLGLVFAQDRTKVMNYLKDEMVLVNLPKNIKFAWSSKANENNMYELYALKTVPNQDGPKLDGDAIVDARGDLDPTGQFQVDMTMNGEGAQIWRRMTKDNTNRSIAIVLDDKVYTAPNVLGEIGGGRSQITGNFSATEAQDLASIIRAGKLPAPARIVQEEFVGPSLGAESIQAGTLSLIVGLLLVLVFMIFYYNKSGIIADLALLLNLILIMGTLASLGASLTLPGMAGIVLTIGMAVDANVIIFERIREELRKGKGLRLAISEGYSKSYSAIIDANITTLITGFILLAFGIGPVRGFAIILVIGIFSSFATAVLVSRLVMEGWTKGDKGMSFGNKLTENVLDKANFDFLSKRKIMYAVSTIIIVLGIASMAVRGFNYGVDFSGGRTYIIAFEQPVSTVDVTNALRDQFETEPVVKTFGNDQTLQITTKYLIEETSTEADSIVDAHLYDGLLSFYKSNPDFDTFIQDYKKSGTKVGPTIADDIKSTSVYAAIFSFIAIFVYLLIRFSKWQFGFGALVAVLHDALILLSVFSLLQGLLPFSLEIDQAFIAALLTIIGYSINDTVIVFDRVREYLLEHPSKQIKDIANMAVNSTLSRTLMTSFTTLIVVIILFLFGGNVIRGFSFALLIGILVGTYSSIFVATPLVVDLFKDKKDKK